MARNRKMNIVLLAATCLLCLTVSGSFVMKGGAEAFYLPPAWELDIEAAETEAAVTEQPEEAAPQYTESGLKLATLYINGAFYGACRLAEDKARVSLEEFAQATGLEYDAQTQTLGGLKLELAESGEYFTVSGRYFYLDGGLIEDGDELLWPLSELGRLFGFDVVWDSASGSLNVDITDPEQLLPGEEFYNSDDVYWLSRIIYAEAGNQTLEGMLAVGDVVMNRAASDLFPNTVYEVIFDRRYGVQFSPTETGSIYLEPAEECVTAAKLCLEGYDIVGGSLYFVNPDIGVSSWFRLTRTYVTSIGDHDFYA